MSTRTAQRLSCDAVLQRVVTSPTLGPLDVGRSERLVTVAIRTALEARDAGCVVPGCGVAPAQCDAHHVVHWADGGVTSLANMVLLCAGHHTAVHSGTWQVRVVDGQVEVVPPRWVDPPRRPRLVRHHVVERALDELDACGTARTAGTVDPPVDLGPPPERRATDAADPPVDLGPRPPRPPRPTGPSAGPVIDLGPPPDASPPPPHDIDLGPPLDPSSPGPGDGHVDLSVSPLCELLEGLLQRQHSVSVWERRRAMATVQP